MQSIIATTLVVLAVSPLLRADNGAMATVSAIPEVQVDGDLSDWPEDLQEHLVDLVYEGVPDSRIDLSTSIRVGYVEGDAALYVAAKTQDESVIVDRELPWDAQDCHLLFVDATHSALGSAPVLYTANDLEHAVREPLKSWDPAVRGHEWGEARVAIQRGEGWVHYEWRIPLPRPIESGSSIGFDYVVLDRDADSETVIYEAWGPGTSKSGIAGGCGDLLFLEESTAIGGLSGRVHWQDEARLRLPPTVRVTRLDGPPCMLHAPLNGQRYELQLPPGRYRIESTTRSYNSGGELLCLAEDLHVEAQVEASRSVDAPDLILRPPAPLPEPPAQGFLHEFDPAGCAALDEFMERALRRYDVPGASLSLVSDVELVYSRCYGEANRYTGEAVREDSLFEAASITKAVFAFAVVRLAERGVLDLHQPLHELLPFPEIAHDERYREITAYHCLTHGTGFPNWAYNNADGKIDIKFQPGTRWGYSGEGFEYLGRVVSHVTGKPLEQVLDEEVREPLGIGRNMFFSTRGCLDTLLDRLTVGHRSHLPSSFHVNERPGMAHSMLTEARTFSAFLIGLLDERGLDRETFEDLFHEHREVPLDEETVEREWAQSFGLGVSIRQSPWGKVVEHSGNNGDYRCLFQIYHELGIGYALFTNGDHGSHLARELRRYLITGAEGA